VSAVQFVLRHSRVAHALFIILSLLGVAAWQVLPIEVYPRIRTSSAVVMAVWPGATAKQVEQYVTSKLEEQTQGVLHVDWYRSESTSNLARLVVRFKDTASKSEIDSAFTTMQNRMRQIDDLPEGCEPPVASRFRLDEDSPFLRICVFDQAETGPLSMRDTALRFQEDLESIGGISKVTLLGTGNPEIRILLDRTEMEDAGLTVAEVAMLLKRSNVAVPVGAITTDEHENPVRLVARQHTPEELADVLVGKNPLGAQVRLGDIAKIEELLRDLLDKESQATINVDIIQRTVAEHFDLRQSDILGKRRSRDIAWPRQIAMHLSRTMTSQSFPVIGEAFSRNHATILYANDQVAGKAKEDRALQQTIAILKDKVNKNCAKAVQ
jgi:HAE1 family hydrophobic/amphiphilic exporter-1